MNPPSNQLSERLRVLEYTRSAAVCAVVSLLFFFYAAHQILMKNIESDEKKMYVFPFGTRPLVGFLSETLNRLQQQQDWQAIQYVSKGMLGYEEVALAAVEQNMTRGLQLGWSSGGCTYAFDNYLPQEMKENDRVRRAAGKT